MALGFGFNKAKVLNSAERHVQQGKLQNAIHEYEKVAREDPRDLTVLNTIGDLYARLGQSDKAGGYFRKVGDAYASEGFIVKAIALYKKLTKLVPNSVEGLQKLAELYTQQGLYNDARQQYVLLADHWMRTNDLEGAARVFQKMLELDPENSAMQSKLADLYLRMGKKEDAKEIYFRAAESLYQRAALDAADDALGRILGIDPANQRALLKRAQIAVESGDGKGALAHLKRLPQLESSTEAMPILLRAQLLAGNAVEAESVARKLVAKNGNITGIEALAEWLMSAGRCQQGLALYREFAAQLTADSNESLERTLELALHKVKDDAVSLEIVRELYGKLGDKSHLNECTELLAHALVQSGELTRARDLYRDLAEAEPENPMHQQQYRQVLVKLGEDAAVRPLTTEEGSQAFLVDELEMSAPTVAQEYPEHVAEAIQSALTDSELLDSYNLPQKAVTKLEAVVPSAPRDIRLNQRLASLYAASNRYAEAARCCGVLESVYLESGFADQAAQYRDMAAKYQERVQSEPSKPVSRQPEAPAPRRETAAPVELTLPEEPPVLAAKPVAAAASAWEPSSVSSASESAPVATTTPEIDLSDEWETQAVSAVTTAPDAVAFETQIAAAARGPEVVLQSPAAELGINGWEKLVASAKSAATPSPADSSLHIEIPPSELAQPAASATDELNELVSELEQSLGSSFAEVVEEAPAAVLVVPPEITAPAPADVARPAAKPAAANAPAAAARQPLKDEEEASTVLSDMFAEFKEEAETGTEQLEDPETHYNLGVAFREMGLMDEAIGELQKVCAAVERGVEFPHTMQAYTWLAQCFVEKGVPEASYKWYEKALTISTDEQQRMSLHYDLAGAYEAAGNRKAALQHFMEVYGTNIDFRDVAQRIKALRP